MLVSDHRVGATPTMPRSSVRILAAPRVHLREYKRWLVRHCYVCAAKISVDSARIPMSVDSLNRIESGSSRPGSRASETNRCTASATAAGMRHRPFALAVIATHCIRSRRPRVSLERRQCRAAARRRIRASNVGEAQPPGRAVRSTIW